MHKSQLGRMQRQSWCTAFVADRSLPYSTTIFHIPANGMTQFSQMNSNLVGTPRFQPTLHFMILSQMTQWRDVCHHPLAKAAIRRTASQPVSAVANLTTLDRLRRQPSRNHTQVSPQRIVCGELFNQPGLSPFIASKHKDPAGLAINPMHGQQLIPCVPQYRIFPTRNQTVQTFLQ